MSFLVPNRTVLLIADEALYIYTTGGKGVRLVETVPWDADNFVDNVASVIARDCGRKPVLIMNDMVEQHYRKERIMQGRVGVLDKANMLKRKLNVAFPNYPIRAAFPLKEKIPKTESTAAADVYIFAAVPDSAQYRQTSSSAQKSLASISAFCLLPVESSDMVKTLTARLFKKKKSKAMWSVFIGQHRNGSLRQIVTKNGELALTRMTPIIDNDTDADLWASEVHQEFKATMSYLSRFGYQPEDGLEVAVIANPSAGQILESLVEEECEFSTLGAQEAARLLKLPIGRQEDMRYADVLHVAWGGRKNKFILPMKATEVDKVSRPRQAAMVASVLLLGSASFFGYQLFGKYQELSSILSDVDDYKSRKAQLDVQYNKEVQRKEDLGFNVRLVQSSITVHENLEKQRIQTLPLFKGVGQALGKDLRVDRINVQRPEKKFVNFIPGQDDQGTRLYEAKMQMTYPSTTNIDRGNREVSDLRDRLRGLLPDHSVEVTKFLKDYEYVEEIVVETGDLERQDVQQDFVAEITIQGPVMEVEQEQPAGRGRRGRR